MRLSAQWTGIGVASDGEMELRHPDFTPKARGGGTPANSVVANRDQRELYVSNEYNKISTPVFYTSAQK